MIDLQIKLRKPIIQSDTAFTLNDRSLHIESVAADPATGNFYLGSIHKKKIIEVGKDGRVGDFTTEGQDGLTSVFGTKIDPKKRVLWVCSSPMEEMESYDSLAPSTVSEFDLRSGKLLHQYRPSTSAKNIFGDLALNSRGEVFVSDSKNNIIFRVNQENGSLDSYFKSGEFWNLQGLSFSDDDRFLFIADYVKGPFRLDTRTNMLIKIETNIESSLKGIDGLLFYKNSLIAIQNGTNPLRVTRHYLDSTLSTIVRDEIIDSGHPAFNEPTIGTIYKGMFYYVANSQWGGYNDQHQINHSDKLQDIVILKYAFK